MLQIDDTFAPVGRMKRQMTVKVTNKNKVKNKIMAVKFYQAQNQVPLVMHKVRMVQKLSLLPVEERLKEFRRRATILSFCRIAIFILTCSPTRA